MMFRYVDLLELAHIKSCQYVIYGDVFIYLKKVRSDQLRNVLVVIMRLGT